ncbi:hypothetical protein HDU67_000472 [Dinochytrium kinnereticum]|nr:hypothetical protein HDU67_000472 [Dinochytrium kinnereticum]
MDDDNNPAAAAAAAAGGIAAKRKAHAIDLPKIASAAGPYLSPSTNNSTSPIPSLKAASHQHHAIPTPNRRQRRLQFGIDCADMVHFTHWEPGGEHVKHLVVKNVVMKTQKISDVIEFTTSFGKFYLPIKATLPEHVLEFPESIDFSLCPVKEVAKRIFTLKNTGELASTYEWDIAKPFSITPRTGTLLPGQSCPVTIEFKPHNASVFTATAVCKFGDKDQWEHSEVTQALTIYGIGKYSHLAIEGKVTQFDFGEVYVGKSVEKRFTLENHSAVPANFQIKHTESDTEPYFVFSTQSGTIPSHRKMEISISYTPVAAEMISTEYFNITTQSGNTLQITCSGSGIGPRVALNTNLINFNDVPSNTTVIRPLYIQNHSPIAAFYQMLKSGIIRSDNGVLSYTDAKYHPQPARLLDSPYTDGNMASEYFYENTGSNLAATLLDTYVDFGSCSRYRIIDNQVIRISNNTNGKMSCVWRIPGEAEPKADNSFYGAQLECFVYFKSMRNFRLVNEDSFTPPWCLTPTVAGNTFPPGEDTFIPKINFGASRLDFPSCHVDKSVYRTVRVSNTGDTPVKFAFLEGASGSGVGSTLHGIGGGTPLASEGGAPFSVKPRTGILHKSESKLIVFRFSPGEQRDLHVRGVGYVPHISFENQNILCFRPTCIGSRSSRVFLVRNTSRITVDFEVRYNYHVTWKIPKQYSSFVSIEPMVGKLMPNSKLPLLCTFTPNIMKSWVLRLPCYYSHEFKSDSDQNNDGGDLLRKHRATLTVIGNAADSRLTAEPGTIDFGAILVNTVSEREITLYNTADCDVFYTLSVNKVLKVETGDAGDEKEDQNDAISLSAAAQPKPQELQEIETELFSGSELEVLHGTDVLPARSKHVLKIRACIRDQIEHVFRIYYSPKAYSGEDRELDSVKKQSRSLLKSSQELEKTRFFLCEVRALGVNPIVQVTDIRSENTEKPLLWDLFSLDQFNSILSAIEPTNSRIDRTDSEEFPIDGGNAILDAPESPSLNFNFGAAPIGSKTKTFYLSLMNPGVVPVAWIYYFPNDLEVEIENWADPGDYSEEQIHTNLILDNALFTISPKSGVLHPGESVNIVMTYRHEFAGLHTLPVVFKLKNGTSRTDVRSGKEVLVYFIGYTVPIGEKCLYFHSSQHRLQPVPIGAPSPPIQTYNLYNRGSVPLDYHIDTNPLKLLKEQEHSFDIISCLNPTGCIQPGGTASIDWIFRPLEAKEYKVDIPIIVAEGKTHIVTFSGEGLEYQQINADPKSLKDTIPKVQKLSVLRQIASLSLERANFGFVPAGSQSRQITVLRNMSTEMDLSFRWIIPTALQSVLKVAPQAGRLSGGQSRVCKFIFTPLGSIRIYDADIACEIVNETEMKMYEAEREEMNIARREGRMMSMEIHQPTLRRERHKPVSDIRSKQHSFSISDPRTSNLKGKKYKRLPNISPPKSPSASVHEFHEPQGDREDGGRDSSLSSNPDSDDYNPPEPFVIFFSILARVDSVGEFSNHFTGLSSFYHPKKIFYSDSKDLPATLMKAECSEIISGITLSLLDDVIQDLNIDSFSQMPAFPYFAQLIPYPRNGILIPESEEEIDTMPSEKAVMQPKEMQEQILSSYEFQNLSENILESTIFNIMQEVEQMEFDFTRYCMTIVTD